MKTDFTYTTQRTIKTNKATLWRHVTQMNNVNAELMPLVRMTYSADRAELGAGEVPMGVILFKSVILLFGFLPIDLHSLKFDKIVEREAFYENSVTLMHRYWKHTRSLTDVTGGVLVRDVVHFSPRLPGMGYLVLPVYRMVFRHRHRRLSTSFI